MFAPHLGRAAVFLEVADGLKGYVMETKGVGCGSDGREGLFKGVLQPAAVSEDAA